MAALDAEGADQEVDGAADRDALGAQAAVVQGGGDRQLVADHGLDGEALQGAAAGLGLGSTDRVGC